MILSTYLFKLLKATETSNATSENSNFTPYFMNTVLEAANPANMFQDVTSSQILRQIICSNYLFVDYTKFEYGKFVLKNNSHFYNYYTKKDPNWYNRCRNYVLSQLRTQVYKMWSDFNSIGFMDYLWIVVEENHVLYSPNHVTYFNNLSFINSPNYNFFIRSAGNKWNYAIIHKDAKLKRRLRWGGCVMIGPRTIIGYKVFLGNAVVISNDCIIGDFSSIECYTLVGSGTFIGKGINIGIGNIIGNYVYIIKDYSFGKNMKLDRRPLRKKLRSEKNGNIAKLGTANVLYSFSVWRINGFVCRHSVSRPCI